MGSGLAKCFHVKHIKLNFCPCQSSLSPQHWRLQWKPKNWLDVFWAFVLFLLTVVCHLFSTFQVFVHLFVSVCPSLCCGTETRWSFVSDFPARWVIPRLSTRWPVPVYISTKKPTWQSHDEPDEPIGRSWLRLTTFSPCQTCLKRNLIEASHFQTLRSLRARRLSADGSGWISWLR